MSTGQMTYCLNMFGDICEAVLRFTLLASVSNLAPMRAYIGCGYRLLGTLVCCELGGDSQAAAVSHFFCKPEQRCKFLCLAKKLLKGL